MTDPIVLVHGGWLGGWAWDDVVPHLAGAGYEVHTPTLIGLGERAAEGSADIDVSAHATDLIAGIEPIGRPVLLVGHSYSGMVVTAIADRRPDLVAHLIVLDGFVPRDGESIFDLIDPAEAAATREEQATNGGYRPPPDPSRWGFIEDEGIRKLLIQRLTPHPGAASSEHLQLHGRYAGPCTYISMSLGQRPHFVRIADRLRCDPLWRLVDYEGPHLDMLFEPERLARALVDVL